MIVSICNPYVLVYPAAVGYTGRKHFIYIKKITYIDGLQI